MSYKQRQLKLIEIILSYKSFNLVYKASCKAKERLSDNDIIKLIKKAGVINPQTGNHIVMQLIKGVLVL